jgi:hypothetical protein
MKEERGASIGIEKGPSLQSSWSVSESNLPAVSRRELRALLYILIRSTTGIDNVHHINLFN